MALNRDLAEAGERCRMVERIRSVHFFAADKDHHNLEVIRDVLERFGLGVITTDDSEMAITLFREIHPRIALIDETMRDAGGNPLFEKILSIDPGIEVIVMTEHRSSEFAIEVVRMGASHCMVKPIDVTELQSYIERSLAEAKTRNQTAQLNRQLLDRYQFQGLIGKSPRMLDVFARIRRVAPHFRNVLIVGQTGTGKELVARALHDLSPVANNRFVACNCAAFTDTLLESELFGHARGAFTGATHDKEGLFEYASGGTIFLDEIGELSLSGQAKLLRVLQNREVQRVGSPRIRSVDVRIVAATNRDLQTLARECRFRQDLYYRLAMIIIVLPSLLDRMEDLPLLERHFLEKFSAESGKQVSGFSRRAQIKLSTYPWPGNVRELENVIQDACVMTENDVVDIGDLPSALKEPREVEDTHDIFAPLEEIQKRHVLRVLKEVGNKARAAEILKIGRATLYDMLARWDRKKTEGPAA
jgi:DNA-binding NtrC family response regulator